MSASLLCLLRCASTGSGSTSAKPVFYPNATLNRVGGSVGAVSGALRDKPNTTYRHCVQRCLTDKGFDVIGWNEAACPAQAVDVSPCWRKSFKVDVYVNVNHNKETVHHDRPFR